VHSEMPEQEQGRMRGFQLWVNLPAKEKMTDPRYQEFLPERLPGAGWLHALPEGHNAFAYAFEGDVALGEGDDARPLSAQEMAVLGGGDVLKLKAGDAGARLIVVAGRPLREPVARHGPFVMNTKQEIMQAFVDYQEGRF
jgi:quercetin 2,3-dioxygenase